MLNWDLGKHLIGTYSCLIGEFSFEVLCNGFDLSQSIDQCSQVGQSVHLDGATKILLGTQSSGVI
jgi:hypothetical protein